MNARDFFSRFKEPSTWAGVSMLAGMFGVPATSGLTHTLAQIGAGVAAAAAIGISEKGNGSNGTPNEQK